MLRRHVSISLRLTAWFGGIFFVGFLLFGAAMWLNLKHTLTGERRLTLARRLDRLEDLLTSNRSESSADRAQDFRDFAHATGNGLGQVMHADGTPAYPAPSSAAAKFPWPDTYVNAPESLSHVSAGGQPYWVLSRRATVAGEPLVLLAAAPEAGNLQVLHSFLMGLLAAVPLVLLVASAAGYWISRRALRPVDAITATARQIGIRNLSERLTVSATGDELQRLAVTWNDMLDRLESSVRRLKQFTADASHELRGPLSFTRTVAEIALRNPHADPGSRQALTEIVDEAIKSSSLLEQMLQLARADTDLVGVEFQTVNLAEVVDQACAMARPLAHDKGLTLQHTPSHPLLRPVMGDAASLARLLWILLDNAIKYTPAPGSIEVSLAGTAGAAILSVKDSGIGIAASDLPLIFDRFYRADPSRSQTEGSGLGLSIARWIAEIHHADLTVTSEPTEGSLFQLRCPLA